MLVLSRKRQEVIQIGDDVTITILQVKGQTVRLGIEAPRQVRVLRGELPPTPAVGDRPLPEAEGTRANLARTAAARRPFPGHRGSPRARGGNVGVTAGSQEGRAEHSPLASLVQESMRVVPMTVASH